MSESYFKWNHKTVEDGKERTIGEMAELVTAGCFTDETERNIAMSMIAAFSVMMSPSTSMEYSSDMFLPLSLLGFSKTEIKPKKDVDGWSIGSEFSPSQFAELTYREFNEESIDILMSTFYSRDPMNSSDENEQA